MTGDRILVEHRPHREVPVDWPEGLAPRVQGERTTTYALWVADDGSLHSAVRVGQVRADSLVAMARLRLDDVRSGIVDRLPEAHPLPARAVTFQVRRGELVAGPIFWRGPAGAPTLPEGELLDAAACDIQRRRAPDDSVSWLAGLAGGAAILTMNVLDALGFGVWRIVAAVAGYSVLLLVDTRWRHRRRLRRLHGEGAVEVSLSDDVPLTATPLGVELRVGGPPS